MKSSDKYIKSKDNNCELEPKDSKSNNDTFFDDLSWADSLVLSKTSNYYSPEVLRNHLEDIYEADKIIFIVTGVWPDVRFSRHDSSWVEYCYRQLKDSAVIILDKYFDFDYDSSFWTREKLIELTDKYGKNILLSFYLYSKCNSNIPFEDWYEEYINTYDWSLIAASDEDFDNGSNRKTKVLVRK